MGAACCVAAGDRTIQHGSSDEIPHRNFRCSPSWSFRWDNRVGIVGEETSIGWLSDATSRNDGLDVKSATDVSAHASDGGSSLENYMGSQGKSPLNQKVSKNVRISAPGPSIARNASVEVKQSIPSPQDSDPISVKLSPSVHSTPSVPMWPSSSKSHLLPPPSTPSRCDHGSPRHQVAWQASDSHSSGRNSPSMNSVSEGQASYGITAASNESTRGSYGKSLDGWSEQTFSELMSASQRERWSFNSDCCSFTHDKLSRTSGQNSGSISMDFQSCGICSKLLTERSAWSSQKIFAGNEFSVVAVLICGHVYHAECLETVTPEINKYDPACPACTFEEKQTLKMPGKMKDLNGRSIKKSRNRIVDTDRSVDCDYSKSRAHEGKSPKLSASSSLKFSAAKPFLRRHFSIGSRSNKSASENPSIRKKGLFWAKSSRE